MKKISDINLSNIKTMIKNLNKEDMKKNKPNFWEGTN